MNISTQASRRLYLAVVTLAIGSLSGCGGGASSSIASDANGSGPLPTAIVGQRVREPSSSFAHDAVQSAAIAQHVLTAEYVGSYGGYSGSLGVMGQYSSWAVGASPSAAHAAGMKVYAYTDPNRSYHSDDDYRIQDLLSSHPGAIAKNCGGATITTEHGNGILTDVRTRDAIGHTTDLAKHVDAAGTDAVFMDDSDDVQYTDNGLPCNYNAASWLAGQKAMYAAQTVPIIFNGLSLLEYNVDPVPLADVSAVIGAMWEGCYGFHSEWGYPGDGTDGLREDWSLIENAQIAMAAKGKTFWCFNTQANAGSSNVASRTYAYASFLLTYDARTSLYETKMSTGSGLRIYPETGIVVSQPLITAPASVSVLKLSTSAYGREYRACYYRAASIGACAVVVNPDTASHGNPYTGYRHTLILKGAGVLDGGSVATDGGPAPASLGGHSAAILLR